ncbi:MAG: RQC domain-containing protein, partial [Porticoccaceae bacterium]
FGVNYLIDVLHGKVDERVQRFGHDKITTFGIGNDLSVPVWRSLFRQLIARGLLNVDAEGHGGLRLAERCRPVLQGAEKLWLRKELPAARATRKSRAAGAAVAGADAELWEALRRRRRELAEEQGVPPYAIFHDATLMELMAQRPQTLREMARISGIGSRKLEAYGDTFLALIGQYSASRPGADGSDTHAETLTLFRAGMDVAAIARQRGLRESTIYTHMAEAVLRSQVELVDVVGLDRAAIDRILAMMELHDGPGLKPVFEALEGRVDYGVLRCIQAARMAGK